MKAADLRPRHRPFDQEPENQLAGTSALRRSARDWTAVEVRRSRACRARSDRRPALDQLRGRCPAPTVRRAGLLAARSPRAQPEAPDHAARRAPGARGRRSSAWPKASTPRRRPAKLQMHILGAIAEFERARIRERVMQRVWRGPDARHRLGDPDAGLIPERLATVAGLPGQGGAARQLGIPRSTLQRLLAQNLPKRPCNSRTKPGCSDLCIGAARIIRF